MLFSPKRGPVFTAGRLQHLCFGAALAVMGGLIGGTQGTSFYDGASIATLSVAVLGGTWEVSTAHLAKKTHWKHPWGDIIDFAAFQIGAWLVAIPSGLLGH